MDKVVRIILGVGAILACASNVIAQPSPAADTIRDKTEDIFKRPEFNRKEPNRKESTSYWSLSCARHWRLVSWLPL
jgi:hypothetical protein